MKKLLIGLVLSVAVRAPVFADVCSEVERMAYASMKANQARVPLTKLLDVIGNDSYSRAIAIDAYNVKSYLSDEAKEIQRQKFAQKWLMKCIGG